MTDTNLKSRIETLIHEVETTHRYSMSRIYGLYNEAFDTNEKPQSCASCLMRKVRELKFWLENQKEVNAVIGEDETKAKEIPADSELSKTETKKTARKKQKNGTQKN